MPGMFSLDEWMAVVEQLRKNGGEDRMNRYQCIYCDLRNNKPVAVEEVRAGEATEAFQQFIRNRRNEDWTVAEIFRRSNLKIVPFGSDDRYIIDSYGEVVKETDYFRIAG